MSQDTNKAPDSPMIKELQGIIDGLPKMAANLPGLPQIIKFVGKVVRRQDRLEARISNLESVAKG